MYEDDVRPNRSYRKQGLWRPRLSHVFEDEDYLLYFDRTDVVDRVIGTRRSVSAPVPDEFENGYERFAIGRGI